MGDELDRPLPEEPIPCAPISIERRKDDRGYNYVVRFPSEIKLKGSRDKRKTVWFNTKHSEDPRDASKAA